tara:strand:+ start:2564 stop:2713 length:150 start_codon:yes stop_codon:yes gene_type:complete
MTNKIRKDRQGNVWVGQMRFTKGGMISLGIIIFLISYVGIAILFGEGTA